MSSIVRQNVEFSRDESTDRATADAAIQAELDVTQSGSGLDASGNYVANVGANYLAAATSLFDADDKLDAQVKTVADNLATLTTGTIANIQTEVDAIETGAGLETDGTYVADTTGTATINTATSLHNADRLLDLAVQSTDAALTQEVTDRTDADAAIQTELNTTQTGSGLNADGTYPTNTGGNFINTSTSIVDSVNDLDTGLDAEVTARTNAVATVQTEVDAIETGAGLGIDGTYTADATTNYLTAATSLKDADKKLDTQIKTVADELAALGTGSITDLQTELDATQTGAGLGIEGVYTADGASNYASGATSLFNADQLLDAAIKVNTDAIAALDTATGGDLTTETNARIAQDDVIEAGAGLETDGTYLANGTANYINFATSLKDADNKLDTQMKANADAITSEETARIAAVGANTTAINNEVTARTNADTAIQGELDATQTGAGLEADGSYVADGTADYISAATSLKNADSLLDDQIKAVADDLAALGSGSITDLQTEVDAIETGAGLGTDGTYTADGTADYISAATSLKNADSLLDDALKAEETARVSADDTIQAELDVTQTGAGLGTDGTYTADALSDYITGATSLANADSLLDDQIKANNVRDDAQDVSISEKVAKAGDTMTGILNMGDNRITSVGSPTIASDAATKAYVDSLSTGLSWTEPVYYVDLVRDDVGNAGATNPLIRDLQTPANDTAELISAEDSDMYVIGNSAPASLVLRAVGTTGNIADSAIVTPGTVVRFDADLSGGGVNPLWEVKGHITTYPNEVVDGLHDPSARWCITTTTAVSAGGTFAGHENVIVELVDPDPNGAGTASYDALWGFASTAGIAEEFSVQTVADVAGSLDGTYFTLNTAIGMGGTFDTGYYVWFDNTGTTIDPNPGAIGTQYGIKVSLTNDDSADAVATKIATAVNSFRGGIFWYIERTNDLLGFTDHHIGNITNATAGTSGFTVVTTVAGSNSSAPQDGLAFFVNNPDSFNFGNQYTYDSDELTWVQFGGSATLNAGVGLVFAGNTINANLGAGVAELPTDEIGVETKVDGGLFTTVDGISASTDTAATLAVKLDGSTLSLSTSGLKLADAQTNAITTNASNISTEITNRTNADATIQTEVDAIETGAGLGIDGTYTADAGSNYITAATSLKNADSLLDDQIKINADAIAALGTGSINDLQTEVDAIETSVGLATDGTFAAFTGTNYINAATSIKNASELLDTQLLATTTTANAAEPDLGVGVADDYVLTTTLAGVRSWMPFNQTQVGRIQQTFTATEGQSVFNLVYSPDLVDVFLNGMKLVNGSDFTASNGTSITVTPALSLNDVLDVVSYEQYVYANVPQLTGNDLYIVGDVHATAYYTDSARVLKENIVETGVDALAMINSTEVVEFNYKTDESKKRRIGFIADDTDPLMSGANQDAFDTTNVVGVLMKAVQELSAQNAVLEARLSDLEG